MASVGRRPQSAYAGGTRSYMGAQVLSHKASSPSFSFGSSPSRVQVTIERSASKDLLMPSVASSKEKTPGPIYNPLPARRYLGDGPRHVFGTEEQRPPLARVSKSTGKSSTPGPGAYAVPSSMGHQSLGLRASSSAYSFGLSRQRVSLSRAKSAGPGLFRRQGATRHTLALLTWASIGPTMKHAEMFCMRLCEMCSCVAGTSSRLPLDGSRDAVGEDDDGRQKVDENHRE